MSFKIDILQYCWSFIRSVGSKFLDCEITTSSGKLLTNKCFLVISDLLWKSIGNKIDGQCKILMPRFHENEIREELRGFVVQSEQEHALDPFQVSCGLENQTLRTISSKPPRQTKGPVLNQILKSCEESQIPQKQIKGPVSNQSANSCKVNQISRKTVQEIKSFQCEHCGKVFSSSKQCRQHRYQVHKPTNNHCTICGAGFKTKSILSNHFKTHNSPNFSCGICSKVLTLPFNTFSNQ